MTTIIYDAINYYAEESAQFGKSISATTLCSPEWFRRRWLMPGKQSQCTILCLLWWCSMRNSGGDATTLQIQLCSAMFIMQYMKMLLNKVHGQTIMCFGGNLQNTTVFQTQIQLYSAEYTMWKTVQLFNTSLCTSSIYKCEKVANTSVQRERSIAKIFEAQCREIQ